MATSFKIVVLLIALALFAFVYGVALDPHVEGDLKPLAQEQTDTTDSQTFYDRLTEMWDLAPVFVSIAGVAWLIKQTVVGAPR